MSGVTIDATTSGGGYWIRVNGAELLRVTPSEAFHLRPVIHRGAVSDAARLRSLAARMDSQPDRGRSFTGAEVAAMLRDGEEAGDA